MEKKFELMMYVYNEEERITTYKLKKNNGKLRLLPETITTKFTESLINFLNSDEPCKYLLDRFGLMGYEYLYEEITKNKMKLEFDTKSEYNEYVETVIDICKSSVIEAKNLFSDYLSKIYNHNKDGLYDISSKPMRMLIFMQDKSMNIKALEKYQKYLNTDIEINVENIKSRTLLSNIVSKYYLKSNKLLALLYAELTFLLRDSSSCINRCEYCGDFFNPLSRIDEKFCSKVYPDGSSCKSLGVRKNWKNILQEDEVRKTYNNLYQKKLMYCKRNTENEKAAKEFEEWKKITKELMKKYKKGEIDKDKVLNMLKE